MTHFMDRPKGRCAYLVSKTDACCEPVGSGSAMAARFCPEHYERMIDRPGMVRAQAKRGTYTKGVPARLVTVWDEAREGKRG